MEQLLRSRHAALVSSPQGTGSGFPITEDSWLTAWHVVHHSVAVDTTIGDFQVLEIIRLPDMDAALLVTAPHDLEPWPLAARNARAGERVYKSGYGAGDHSWAEGIASEDPEQAAITLFGGDSGGALFNARGEVLGMLVAVTVNHVYGRPVIVPHMGWILPISTIRTGLLGLRTPLEAPADGVVLPEDPWERFRRLKKERSL